MMLATDLSKVLYINLTSRRCWVKEKPELFRAWIGGTGVGIKLLEKECPLGADPLGPENPIIISIGYFNGIYPLASKAIAMFKSPLNGNLGESHAGGRCAVALRMAGLGAVVIKGRSETPVYLVIDGEKVRFRDASALWGMESCSTVGRIIRDIESGGGIRAIMRIGIAGERMVKYACVTTETYRHFGRLGLGAVFGSKKLKAIQISGRESFKMKDPKSYRQIYDSLFNTFKSPLMKKYHDLGTPMNVLPLNATKTLPTKNLLNEQYDGAEALSGERIAESFLGRRTACAHCPVSCIHVAALREPYENEPYFYKTKMISYDYEPIYALAAMLDIRRAEDYLRLMDKVEEVGVDAMSTGVALSWATEAMERGIIKPEDAGGLELKWGDYRAYIKAVDCIARRKYPLFDAMAEGVLFAAKKYGGEEFALAFGGNEMPGYHTGPAAYVGYITGARHSHLDGAGYSIDQKMACSGKAGAPPEVAKLLFDEESVRQVLSSLAVCYFARGAYTLDVVSKCFRPMGIEISADELANIGRAILKAKYAFKYREGFSLEKECTRLPARIFERTTPLGMLKREDLIEAVMAFERLVRGD
ncbi:MAG: aldehyde:ferredoxin oxidoreductase [Candidatus Methanomethylicia archaeon]|nr:aldehyde:ferredoxin oxidoreductase [Candidatus Methanomethylicia archaeon]